MRKLKTLKQKIQFECAQNVGTFIFASILMKFDQLPAPDKPQRSVPKLKKFTKKNSWINYVKQLISGMYFFALLKMFYIYITIS